MDDLFNWETGQIQGNRNIFCNGGIHLYTPRNKVLSQSVLYNTEQVLWTQGNITGSNGATIVNAPFGNASFILNFADASYNFLRYHATDHQNYFYYYYCYYCYYSVPCTL